MFPVSAIFRSRLPSTSTWVYTNTDLSLEPPSTPPVPPSVDPSEPRTPTARPSLFFELRSPLPNPSYNIASLERRTPRSRSASQLPPVNSNWTNRTTPQRQQSQFVDKAVVDNSIERRLRRSYIEKDRSRSRVIPISDAGNINLYRVGNDLLRRQRKRTLGRCIRTPRCND